MSRVSCLASVLALVTACASGGADAGTRVVAPHANGANGTSAPSGAPAASPTNAPLGDATTATDASPSAPSSGPAWIGVAMDAGSDIGVRVLHVVRGAPAEKAGIRAGDRIVSVGGARVTSATHVSREVSSRKVGETVAVEIERGSSALTANVVLAARPVMEDVLRMDLVGAPAPAFTGTTPLAGAPASLASLRGKVVLLDFWASWCIPCRLIAPRLSALRDKLGAQGLAVVGLTTDDAERAATFVARNQMRYPVLVDPSAETSRAYGVTSLPTLVLVDKAGIVRDVFVGFDPGGEAKLEAAVRALLAEPAPATPSR